MSKTRLKPPPTPSIPPASDDARTLLAKLDAAQSELTALNSQLERLNRLATMGTIAGMIAHEFNNILTPMLSYAQMAAASPDDLPLAQKALQRTITGSERAAKIADAILNFVRDADSKAALGGVFHEEHENALPTANIARVIRDTLACLGRDPSRDGFSLVIDAPEFLEARIQPIALQQVLVNLVLNAQNAMGSKGGTLEIAASRTTREPAAVTGAADSRSSEDPAGTYARSTWNTLPASGWVKLAVRDTGPGIPSDRLERMFTPFGSHHEAGQPRGTGLGMVIARRLIHTVGGWMTVQSTLGRGTTVLVVLPT